MHGHDVRVLEAVNEEDAGFHLGGRGIGGRAIVALRPELGVGAGLIRVVRVHLGVDPGAVDGAGPRRLDDPRQAAGVVEREREALGPVVVVPGADGGDRHDRLQSFDTRCRDRVGQRPVVGLPDHPDVAVCPGGDHGIAVAVDRRGPAVQPFDDRLDGIDVRGRALVRATRGTRRPRHVDLDHGVAPRLEEVVVEEGKLERIAVCVVRLRLALVATAAAEVVGAGVHDHRHRGHALQLPGPDDVGGDEVPLPVSISVRAPHPDRLADGVRVRIHRLRLTATQDERGCWDRSRPRGDSRRGAADGPAGGENGDRQGQRDDHSNQCWSHIGSSFRRRADGDSANAESYSLCA